MPDTSNPKIKSACVGLDIGTHSIKAVELLRQSNEVLIGAADCVSTPAGAMDGGAVADKSALAHELRNLWKRGDFHTRTAVLALDLRQTNIRWHHLEVEADNSLDDTAHAAALRGLPYPSHEAITDFRVLASKERRGRTMHHVALIAARAQVVEDLLDAVEMAGIEPLSVDVSPMCVARVSASHQKRGISLWSGQPEAHCVIGSDSTMVCITRDNGVEFARVIPVGSRHLTDTIAQQLSCDEASAEKIKQSANARVEVSGTFKADTTAGPVEVSCEMVLERLAREIGRSLRHFQSQFPEASYLGMIGRVFLSGGAVRLRGLDRLLADRLSDEINTLNPFAGMSVISTRFGIDRVQGAAPSYSLAVGLAMGHHEMTASPSVVAEAA